MDQLESDLIDLRNTCTKATQISLHCDSEKKKTPGSLRGNRQTCRSFFQNLRRAQHLGEGRRETIIPSEAPGENSLIILHSCCLRHYYGSELAKQSLSSADESTRFPEMSFLPKLNGDKMAFGESIAEPVTSESR